MCRGSLALTLSPTPRSSFCHFNQTRAVWEWYFQDLDRLQQQESAYEAQLQQFLTQSPAEIVEQLSGAQDSREEARRAGVLALRQASAVMDPVSSVRNALAYYVPLRASTAAQPGKAEDYFDMLTKIKTEMAQHETMEGADRLYLLLQGTAGSGKSLFLRRLELKLWQAHDMDPTAPIPVYISLPAVAEAQGDAVRATLRAVGLSEGVMEQLRQEARFVFLLDGYDEVGRGENVYERHRLGDWKAHVLVGARSQFLLSLADYKSLFRHPETGNMSEVRSGLPGQGKV